MSGELVQTGTSLDLPKINMQLNTEDIIHLKVIQVEEQLKAKLEAKQEELRKLHQNQTNNNDIVTNAIKPSFANVIEALQSVGIDTSLDDTDEENDDELEYYCDTYQNKTKKMYMRFHFTLHKKASKEVLDAIEKQQEQNNSHQKLYSEIQNIQNELRNMPAVERKARANLAEWKLKKMGGQEMLDELLGTQS